MPRRGDIAISVSTTDMTKLGVDSAGRNFGRLGKIGSLALTGLKVAAVAAGVAIAGLGVIGVREFGRFLSKGDDLDKMSRRLGITVEELSKLTFAAEQSGASVGAIEKGYRAFTRVLDDVGDGSIEAERTFDKLGLSAEAVGKLSPAEQIDALADALAAVPDRAERLNLAQEALGRSGAELLPLFEGGSAGLAQLRAEAEATGNVISTDTARAAAKFNDTWNQVKNALSGVAVQIFEQLLPTFQRLAEFVRDDVIPAIRRLEPVFESVFKALGIVLTLFRDLFAARIKFILGALQDVVGFLGAVFSLEWGQAWEAIKGVAGDAWQEIGDVAAAALKALASSVGINLGAARLRLDTAWGNIVNAFGMHLGDMTGLWTAWAALFRGDWDGLWTGITAGTGGLLAGTRDVIRATFDAIGLDYDAFRADLQRGWATLFTSLRTVASGAWNAIKLIAEAAWLGIQAVVAQAWAAILGGFADFISVFHVSWTANWHGVGATFRAAWEIMKAVFHLSWGDLLTALGNYFKVYVDVWTSVWNAVKDIFEAIWNFLKPHAASILAGILGAFAAFAQPFVQVWTQFWGPIRDFFGGVWDAIQTKAESVLGAIRAAVQAVVDAANAAIRAINSIPSLPSLPSLPDPRDIVPDLSRNPLRTSAAPTAFGPSRPAVSLRPAAAGPTPTVVNVNAEVTGPVYGVDDLDNRITTTVNDGVRSG